MDRPLHYFLEAHHDAATIYVTGSLSIAGVIAAMHRCDELPASCPRAARGPPRHAGGRAGGARRDRLHHPPLARPPRGLHPHRSAQGAHAARGVTEALHVGRHTFTSPGELPVATQPLELTVLKRLFVLAAVLGAAATARAQDLNGAGATFPFPIYSKWFADYAKTTGVEINYQSIGSGGGIKQFTAGTVDFGATDAPMSEEDMAKLSGPVFHFPTVLGAVVVTYNIPGVSGSIKLTGSLVADVFAGRITKWNDSRITSVNKGVALPASDILVVHRSDGSGTTYIFSDYLSSVSDAWKTAPGKGKELAWPVGLGGKGNEGVAGLVKQTPGSIGYVELAYAKQNGLPAATLQNKDGEWVEPSIEVGDGSGRRDGEGPPGDHGLPRLDRERRRQEVLPDLVVHLAARLAEPGGRGQGEEAGRLPEVVPAQRREARRRRCSTLRSRPRW